jgi:hypothetical protein
MKKRLADLEHLSYSSLSSYLYCPRAWRYHYLDDVVCVGTSPALVFGSAIHGAIEEFLTKRKLHQRSPSNEQPPTLLECWTNSWQHQLADNADKGKRILFGGGEDSSESHFNKGVKLLAMPDVVKAIEELDPALETWPGEEVPTVLIEKQFFLKVPGVPIPVTGYIDLMGSDGVPHDFKTAGKAWSHDQAMGESQPLFYLAALNQLGKTKHQLRFRHVVFVKTKTPYCQTFETQRSWGEVFWVLAQAEEIWKALKAGSFPPNDTGWKCSPKFCDWWDICKR